MVKTKTVKMPAGIRNKLMAAVAMLLVSSIMMVSSTYAWFTLSTAPEVTGITTSVGANGNLEIALLTNTTGANMSTIGSGVGDSSSVKDVTLSNITWGNLVDLSAAKYGLTGIALLPAALNGTDTVSVTNPLLIAEYGADGRVATTNGQTLTAVADANGAFAVSDTPVYGVRAIGTTSTMSVREIALRNAKSTVSAAVNSAKAATRSAINNNLGALITFADGTVPATYTEEQLASFRTIANAVVADLATLESGYKNAAIASAAAQAADDNAFAAAKAIIDPMTLAQLAAAAGDYGLNADAMNALIAAQGNAASAKTTLSNATTTTPGTDVEAAVRLLVGSPAKTGMNVYISGGAVGELGNQLGTYELASVGGLGAAYAGAEDNTSATYVAIATTVAGLNVTGGASATANITDTYGYIIDFAFRTNASGSNLQLQTAAANRVYSDQTAEGLATQGAGSTVTYAFDSSMTPTQVNALLGAIRLVFLNTADGTVYANAGLTDIVVGDTEATANVKLTGQAGDAAPIVALAQNTPTAVSVLVYLDGAQVDNADVPNAASSGMLNLNLQFSSDAELVPMKNTALQTMTAYTVSFNANGGTGIMPDAKAYSATYTLPTTSTFVAPTGKQFAGWSLTAGGAKIETATQDLTADTTLYAVWETATAQEPDPAPATKYAVNIDVNDEAMGTVVADKPTAAKGEEVTLTVTSDSFNVDSLTINGGSVVPNVIENHKTYTFIMPEGEANVVVTFG